MPGEMSMPRYKSTFSSTTGPSRMVMALKLCTIGPWYEETQRESLNFKVETQVIRSLDLYCVVWNSQSTSRFILC